MAYGLIRVRELQAKEVRSADIHNNRKFEENGQERPPHIREGRGLHQSSIVGSLQDMVNERINKAGVKVRSDSVVALEFVVSASNDFFDVYSFGGFVGKCNNWLSERYGASNNIAMYMHEDESTPHAHFIVTPIVYKEVKWKNQKGEGTKTESRLCARDLTGNKKLLEKLQDDYFKFCEKEFGKYCKFNRGTKAAEQKRVYTRETNHELGVLRAQLREADKSIGLINEKLKNGLISPEKGNEMLKEQATIIQRIEEKRKETEDKMQEINDKLSKKIEKHDKKNSNDGWKKGKDFTPGF